MIPLTRPWLGEEEKNALSGVLDSGWLVQGPKVAAFEKAAAETIGVPLALAVSSCTTGLHLALLAAGVKPGDEVIVPSFTYVATANAVEYVGARPVFADVDPHTYNLDTAKLDALVTPRTRAVMPVHLFGLCADMQAVNSFASRHGLKVIEDAACAFGARIGEKHAGTFGDLGCFSFHPRKIITTGEGGMVVARDAGYGPILRTLRNHGATVSDAERHQNGNLLLPRFTELGFNYRMSDLHAALGIEQMRKLESILKARRTQAKRYDERLPSVAGIAVPRVPEAYFHTYQSYVVRVHPDAACTRDALVKKLAQNGVAATQGTHAVHTLDYYRNKYALHAQSCPESARCQDETLTLPLYPGLSESDQNRVVEAIETSLKE